MQNLKSQKNSKKPKKKLWRSPRIEALGNLKDVIKATNPGKSTFGTDGQGGGGGEEMFMAP